MAAGLKIGRYYFEHNDKLTLNSRLESACAAYKAKYEVYPDFAHVYPDLIDGASTTININGRELHVIPDKLLQESIVFVGILSLSKTPDNTPDDELEKATGFKRVHEQPTLPGLGEDDLLDFKPFNEDPIEAEDKEARKKRLRSERRKARRAKKKAEALELQSKIGQSNAS